MKSNELTGFLFKVQLHQMATATPSGKTPHLLKNLSIFLIYFFKRIISPGCSPFCSSSGSRRSSCGRWPAASPGCPRAFGCDCCLLSSSFSRRTSRSYSVMTAAKRRKMSSVTAESRCSTNSRSMWSCNMAAARREPKHQHKLRPEENTGMNVGPTGSRQLRLPGTATSQ